jgi:hypothetical protein
MTTINNEGDQPNGDGFAASESKSGPALLVICTLIRNEQDGWKRDSPGTRSKIVSPAEYVCSHGYRTHATMPIPG